MTKTPLTIDLARLSTVSGGRLFGGVGGWIRPAGVGGGLVGLRQQRLAAIASGGGGGGGGGCPGGQCG